MSSQSLEIISMRMISRGSSSSWWASILSQLALLECPLLYRIPIAQMLWKTPSRRSIFPSQIFQMWWGIGRSSEPCWSYNSRIQEAQSLMTSEWMRCCKAINAVCGSSLDFIYILKKMNCFPPLNLNSLNWHLMASWNTTAVISRGSSIANYFASISTARLCALIWATASGWFLLNSHVTVNRLGFCSSWWAGSKKAGVGALTTPSEESYRLILVSRVVWAWELEVGRAVAALSKVYSCSISMSRVLFAFLEVGIEMESGDSAVRFAIIVVSKLRCEWGANKPSSKIEQVVDL